MTNSAILSVSPTNESIGFIRRSAPLSGSGSKEALKVKVPVSTGNPEGNSQKLVSVKRKDPADSDTPAESSGTLFRTGSAYLNSFTAETFSCFSISFFFARRQEPVWLRERRSGLLSSEQRHVRSYGDYRRSYNLCRR